MDNSVHRVVVVGTGPSSCAAVSALLERGLRPVVLESAPESGTVLSDKLEALPQGMGFKTWNGSDAMYRSHSHSCLTYAPELNVRAANYLGGLSRVWGATFGQYREYRRWPRECIPTEADWMAVARILPRTVTGIDSSVGNDVHRVLPVEPRLRNLLNSGHPKSTLDAIPSTLAISTRMSSEFACELAGTCLQGCPHDAIWWAGREFMKWQAEGYIDLRYGHLVTSIVENIDQVNLHVLTSGGRSQEIHARQVFLGAGAISTAAILVSSGIAPRLSIRDSQTAFGGMLALRGRVRRSQHRHSLSHVWMQEAENSGFMAQMYPPHTSHAERLRGRAPGVPRSLVNRVAERFFPFIAYLDSDQSGTLEVSPVGKGVRVSPGATGNSKAMRGGVNRLAGEVLRSGFLLPPFALEMAPPGGGFHMGASMPHGSRTDEFGRPLGHERLQLVDASVFPHIEAGSITPTVMANAHRIARTVPIAEFE